MVKPASKMLSAISFGVFCRLRAFDHADHAVQKSLPGVGADADDQPVGEQARPACDGGAVAAASRTTGADFACHRAFIHRGDARHDFAVSRENIACFDEIQIIFAKRCRRNDFMFLACRLHIISLGREFLGRRILACLAQRLRLCLAASFCHRFGEIGEQAR